MQHILVYADSLSWGIIPGTRQRLEFGHRWPGIMEIELNRAGTAVRVIEDCLNGRRTVWDDPFKPGRNGLDGLAQRIEIHSPLALAVLMLGTNDFQSTHQHNAWLSAQGIAALVTAIRLAPIEPGMPVPPILIVAPPPIDSPKGPLAPKFAGAEFRCAGMAAHTGIRPLHSAVIFSTQAVSHAPAGSTVSTWMRISISCWGWPWPELLPRCWHHRANAYPSSSSSSSSSSS